MQEIIFNIILPLFGGLALFLYGMDEMGNGLERIAGGSLERILAKLTNNPIKGVFLGLLVTAIIQSSSATTVMVVGFVNSGIMALSQAIGVILGANIGTTVTAWVLSTASLSGDEWYIQIFTPKVFWAIFAAVGIILIMSSKSVSKKRHVGKIFLGFGVLMFGMITMSGAVSGLKDNPQFISIFTAFENSPILGLVVGAILTAVIQSSSASVGILQSLAASGIITFGSAFPIIMGQNIGTCITALLSSIGANKNAKRASMAHFYFNFLGSVLFMIIFYGANIFFKFDFVTKSISPFQIAELHTIFNVVCTIVFLPFIKGLEKLATISVRSSKKEAFNALDERLFNTPSVAVSQALDISKKMFDVSVKSFTESIDLVNKYDVKAIARIADYEQQTDNLEDKLGTYLVKLSSYDMLVEDSNEVAMLLHNIGDFERIGDHALNISELATEMKEKQITFSGLANKELEIIVNALKEIILNTQKAFNDEDIDSAYEIEPLEQVIDNLIAEIKSRHISRLQSGECTVELGFVFSDILVNMERVSDHCSNIAACLISARQSSYETHELISSVKKTDEDYEKLYKAYQEKYALPALK